MGHTIPNGLLAITMCALDLRRRRREPNVSTSARVKTVGPTKYKHTAT